jgi:hypothetical protein
VQKAVMTTDSTFNALGSSHLYQAKALSPENRYPYDGCLTTQIVRNFTKH